MQQRSLFPNGFEVQEQALAALRELHVSKALVYVRRARSLQTKLVGLDELERALEWLEIRVVEPPSVEGAVAAFAALPAAAARGDLDADAVALVETGLAGFLAPRLPDRPGFLDAEQTVPSPRVALLRGDARVARAGCEELLGAGHGDHAGLWFDHADACWLEQRRGEANASYVRALLLGARDGHAYRCRCEPLRGLWLSLVGGARGFAAAADLLLAEAWIAGVLTIAPGNGWLSAAQRRLVHERSEQSPAWRFSTRVYLDRSAGAGNCDVESREEMAVLLPDLFARFVAAVAARQG